MMKIKKFIKVLNREENLSLKALILTGLLFLVISPLTFAIYKGIISSSKSLVAATWNVSLNQEGENNYLSIVPDPNGIAVSYTINITSQSEVDMTYSIVLDRLPTGVSVSLDNSPTWVAETNHRIILTDVGTILYNDVNKTKSHVITFKASNGSTPVTEQEVEINVVAKQLL